MKTAKDSARSYISVFIYVCSVFFPSQVTIASINTWFQKFNWHLLINNNSIFSGFNVLSRNRIALFNIFHSLAAFHVSEKIATFGPTPTTTKKKQTQIHIELLWCNDFLTHRTLTRSHSAKNPQKQPGLWELQFRCKWKWPPHDSTPAKHTGWEGPLNVKDEYSIERDDLNYVKHVACLRCRLFPRFSDFLGALWLLK